MEEDFEKRLEGLVFNSTGDYSQKMGSLRRLYVTAQDEGNEDVQQAIVSFCNRPDVRKRLDIPLEMKIEFGRRVPLPPSREQPGPR